MSKDDQRRYHEGNEATGKSETFFKELEGIVGGEGRDERGEEKVSGSVLRSDELRKPL